MPKTGFVHRVDGFAFGNTWDMRPEDWNQIRGLIQGAVTGIGFHPLVAPLMLFVAPGPPLSNIAIAQIVTDQIVANANRGTMGLCGGMTFAAADYYALSWLPPRGEFAAAPSPRYPGWSGQEEVTLRRYIWNRLLDSLRGNVAVNTLIWMGVARNIIPTPDGQQWLRDRTRDELTGIKASINRGQPCPIALVGTTPDPLNNHQVLVTGYDDPGPWGAGTVRLYVYEPNGPNGEQTIDFDLSGRRPAAESVPSTERGRLMGFFAAQYAHRQPPPALVMSAGLAATPASRVNVGQAAQFTMAVKNQGFGDTPPLKLYVAGRAGGANVDPGGEGAAASIPMNGTRSLVQRTTVAAPPGFRHYFASTLVDPEPSSRAWRLPAAAGAANASTELTVTDPSVPAVNVRLRTNNGLYVCAVGVGGREVVADRRAAREWETFRLEDQNGVPLRSGDRCTLRASSGRFICAEGGGGGVVVADRTAAGPWETFTIMRADGTGGEIVHGRQVALRSSNGQFVCAEGGGGREVVANRNAIGPWETFTIEIV